MNTKLPYCKTKESIKGYQDSIIAKSETNDCVVRAIASSFEIPYDESHELCEKTFKRKPRKGVSMFSCRMNEYFKQGNKIGNKSVVCLGQYGDLYYDVLVKGKKIKRALTVGKFIKENKIGTFLLLVRGHAFTIKNGVVMGNIGDAQKTKKVLQSIWKIV